VRDSIYLINVVGRAKADQRNSLKTLENLQLPEANGPSIPLRAFASFGYQLEQPIVWRRNRLPTITVSATLKNNIQPASVVKQLKPKVDAFVTALPAGYKLEVGGTVEQSAESQGPIIAVVPLMLLAMATFLMIQLQSFQKLFLVVSVAPLGLIGVVLGLLPFGQPLGFVAILGALALIGIIIRNSVILVKQIDDCLDEEGLSPWDAVVTATSRRMRPILLTAAAASLGMVPIAFEVFWEPMAYAMIGGILVATLLTLFFLPALYVTWYRIRETEETQPTDIAAL
jgi:multidrug efflux pump